MLNSSSELYILISNVFPFLLKPLIIVWSLYVTGLIGIRATFPVRKDLLSLNFLVQQLIIPIDAISEAAEGNEENNLVCSVM